MCHQELANLCELAVDIAALCNRVRPDSASIIASIKLNVLDGLKRIINCYASIVVILAQRLLGGSVDVDDWKDRIHVCVCGWID